VSFIIQPRVVGSNKQIGSGADCVERSRGYDDEVLRYCEQEYAYQELAELDLEVMRW
jgi:hypothetical protein